MPPEVEDLVDPTPATPPEPDGPGSGIRGWTVGLALMIVVVIGTVFAVAVALSSGSDSSGSTVRASDVTYVVPKGTGDKIDAGEDVQVIPEQIIVHMDQTLVLVNEDDRTHNLGGYYVRAGETMRINYPRPGLYMNSCSVNSGALVYVHVEA